jgi:hypothetical protein
MVTVALGNGNGTFKPQRPPHPASPRDAGLAVGDLNHDGTISSSQRNNEQL